MGKKSANNAINFERLFSVKDQMARHTLALEAVTLPPAGEGPSQASEEESRGTPPGPVETDDVAHSSDIEPSSSSHACAVAAVEATSTPAAVVATTLQMMPGLEVAANGQAAPVSEQEVFLRIGMTRGLYDRLRAYASLEGKAANVFAREALEASTPSFEPSAPLPDLVRVARAAAPLGIAGPRRTEIRMQVAATNSLHRRLVQLAALRAQTLAASLLDILEARVPAV